MRLRSGTVDQAARTRRRWALALFLLPIAAVIYPPLYDRRTPTLGGVPFFVWYQLAVVVLAGVVTGAVYLLRGEGEQA
jgi:hypothetical protein